MDPVLVRDSDYCNKSGSTKSKIGKHSWTCRRGGGFLIKVLQSLSSQDQDGYLIWYDPLHYSQFPQSSHPSAHIKGGRRAEEEEKVKVSSEPTWIIGCIPDLLDFQDVINDMGYLGSNCHFTLLTFASQFLMLRVELSENSWSKYQTAWLCDRHGYQADLIIFGQKARIGHD